MEGRSRLARASIAVTLGGTLGFGLGACDPSERLGVSRCFEVQFPGTSDSRAVLGKAVTHFTGIKHPSGNPNARKFNASFTELSDFLIGSYRNDHGQTKHPSFVPQSGDYGAVMFTPDTADDDASGLFELYKPGTVTQLDVAHIDKATRRYMDHHHDMAEIECDGSTTLVRPTD